jgi:signal transduction histidine kinase
MMGSLEPIASPDVLDNLASIYSRTRDISRANSDIDTGENYIAHLLSILSNAAPANAKLIIKGENSINWKNLSEEKKIVIYRVLQEFMVNMKKHSTASFVAIIFSKTEKFLNIDYSDNGQGSELSAIKSGNGLKNVENRIISVNGKLNFETEKGKGLKTNIQIPI